MKLNKTSNRKGAILCTGASLLAMAFASREGLTLAKLVAKTNRSSAFEIGDGG